MHKRNVFIIGGISVLVIVPLVIWLFIAITEVRQGVRFIIVPEKATATINNVSHSVSYESALALDPGEYTITLAAKDFEEVTEKVTVQQGKVTDLHSILRPLTEEARRSINQSHYERIESGYRLNIGTEAIEKKYPFVSKLPVVDKFFKAYPCRKQKNDTSSPMIICVEMAVDTPTQRERLNKALGDKGIDTSTTELHFVVDDFYN